MKDYTLTIPFTGNVGIDEAKEIESRLAVSRGFQEAAMVND
jgi:hypothetical protein